MELDLRDTIRLLRKAQGFSQQDMAEMSGISHSLYSKYEVGDENMSLKKVAHVAHLLGATLTITLDPNKKAEVDERRKKLKEAKAERKRLEEEEAHKKRIWNE